MHVSIRRIFTIAGVVSAALLGTSQTSSNAAPVESPSAPEPAALLLPPPAGGDERLDNMGSEVEATGAPEPAALGWPPPAGGNLRLDNMGSEAGAQAVQAFCVFTTDGDHVHISRFPYEASGHGWWENRTCSATLAVVRVQLQQFYTDGRWRNVGTVGTKTVRSGGGAGRRATGRGACTTRDLTAWRSVVDVDLVGQDDDSSQLITEPRDIRCRLLPSP